MRSGGGSATLGRVPEFMFMTVFLCISSDSNGAQGLPAT
jgi:hypothetical protein